MSDYINRWRHSKKDKYIQEYGGKCSCCGLSEKEFLRFDKKLKKVFCMNCSHGIKIYKQCPHLWNRISEEEFNTLIKEIIKK